MSDGPWTLELRIIDPMGRTYSRKAIGVDAFTFGERFVVPPPGPFDGLSFDNVVERIQKKEFRKDILETECLRLGRAMGEHLEDKEGWHGVDRQSSVDLYDRNKG
jgi:hypothetical protein